MTRYAIYGLAIIALGLPVSAQNENSPDVEELRNALQKQRGELQNLTRLLEELQAEFRSDRQEGARKSTDTDRAVKKRAVKKRAVEKRAVKKRAVKKSAEKKRTEHRRVIRLGDDSNSRAMVLELLEDGEPRILAFTDGERIELTHRASSRGAFARGALFATHYLRKRTPGLYNMAQVLALE